MTISTQPCFNTFCHILGLSVDQLTELDSSLADQNTAEQWQAIYQDPQHTGFDSLRRVKARQVLCELWLLYDAITRQQNLSVYTLRHWLLLLIQLADPKGTLQLTKLLLPKAQRRLNQCIDTINQAMKPISLLLPLSLTVLSISNIASGKVGAEQTATNNANELSCVTSLPVAIQQLSQGELALGSLNAIDLFGTSTCSTLMSTEVYTKALSFSTCINLTLNFLNIVFSSLGCVTEGLNWHKSRRNSQSIEASLVHCQTRQWPQHRLFAQEDPALLGKQALQKMAVLEKAKGADHKRNTKLYGGLVVLGVATAVVLNVMSFGAPLILAMTALIINAVIAVVKIHNVLRPQHLARGLKSLQSTDQSPALFERLQTVLKQAPLQLDFQKAITIPYAGFFKKTLSLHTYLENLLHANPPKLTAIVMALEQSDRQALEKALNQHQQVGQRGDAVGMKLYRRLQSSCVMVVPVDMKKTLASCAA